MKNEPAADHFLQILENVSRCKVKYEYSWNSDSMIDLLSHPCLKLIYSMSHKQNYAVSFSLINSNQIMAKHRYIYP